MPKLAAGLSPAGNRVCVCVCVCVCVWVCRIAKHPTTLLLLALWCNTMFSALPASVALMFCVPETSIQTNKAAPKKRAAAAGGAAAASGVVLSENMPLKPVCMCVFERA